MCAPRTVHTPLRNRYIIYFNIIWCDGAASAAAVVQNLFVSSRFSLATQYRSISVALRERQRTYVQLHETTRSVQYFCRSRFFSSLSALSRRLLFINLFTSHSSPFEIDPIVAFIIWWRFFLCLRCCPFFHRAHSCCESEPECRIIITIMTATRHQFSSFFYFDFKAYLIDLT